MEYDSNSLKTDKYGRHLACIWVDDSLLQEELIGEGLAQTYMLQDNYTYAWILQEKQEEAKEEKVGIWSEEVEKQENVIIETMKNEHDTSSFIGLVIIIISLIVAILFERLRKNNKKKI